MGIVGHAFAPEKRYHKDEARNEKKNAAKHSPKLPTLAMQKPIAEMRNKTQPSKLM